MPPYGVQILVVPKRSGAISAIPIERNCAFAPNLAAAFYKPPGTTARWRIQLASALGKQRSVRRLLFSCARVERSSGALDPPVWGPASSLFFLLTNIDPPQASRKRCGATTLYQSGDISQSLFFFFVVAFARAGSIFKRPHCEVA